MNQYIPFPNAIADIRGGNTAPDLIGVIRFYQKDNCVLISANIDGLPESDSGFFGFHIHEGTSCSGDNFSDTGNHYSPNNAPHPRHEGDLPPLMICNGGAYMTVMTDRFHVKDIIGRTVVIHDNPDDFTSQPAGNAGNKIACGIIKNR